MTVPHLTGIRWRCLMGLRASPTLLRRPFLARELIYAGRNGAPRPVSGATMFSLEEAGWVERITIGNEGMPFRTGGPQNAWQVTDAGREAIKACPDTFPGEPVYGERAA